MKEVEIILELTDRIRKLEAENEALKLRLHIVMPQLFNFKEKRKEKGLTLRKVEELTGISNAYLSQLGTGKIDNPSYKVVETLHRLYNGA